MARLRYVVRVPVFFGSSVVPSNIILNSWYIKIHKNSYLEEESFSNRIIPRLKDLNLQISK